MIVMSSDADRFTKGRLAHLAMSLAEFTDPVGDWRCPFPTGQTLERSRKI